MVTVQQQLDTLKPRTIDAMKWLDHPDRTEKEITQWFPTYKKMFDQVTELERKIRCGDNR